MTSEGCLVGLIEAAAGTCSWGFLFLPFTPVGHLFLEVWGSAVGLSLLLLSESRVTGSGSGEAAFFPLLAGAAFLSAPLVVPSPLFAPRFLLTGTS